MARALHSFAQYCSRFPYDLRLAGRRGPSFRRHARGIGGGFSEEDKRQTVEAVEPDAGLSEVARRYGIAARVLFR